MRNSIPGRADSPAAPCQGAKSRRVKKLAPLASLAPLLWQYRPLLVKLCPPSHPCALHLRTALEESIWVAAVAHQKRQPNYRAGREPND